MSNEIATKTTAVAPRSTQELRAFLLEQMLNVAEGRQDAPQAKAICNYAQQVYNTVNLEMKFALAKSKLGDTVAVSVSF